MDPETHPVINLDDPIGKVVGKRKPPSQPLNLGGTKAAAEKWQRALSGAGIPRGVYRFTSHEEAHQWMITARAKRAATGN